jgi:hypothetical protein
MYNILFTAFPIMWFAIFDSEHPRDVFLENPGLYKIGLKSKFLYSDPIRLELW